jgi:hypothetical protein
MRWLLRNGHARSRTMAAALGLKDATVRKLLARIIQDQEWLLEHDWVLTRTDGIHRVATAQS